jgi:hypothetical protein
LHGKPATNIDTAPAIVDRIRRAQEILSEAGEAGDADAAYVAYAFSRWLDLYTPAITFEEAVRLPPTWRKDARADARDRLIRELAERYFSTIRGRDLAREIDREGSRYESSVWIRDRDAQQAPSGLNGAFFRVLCCGGDFPRYENLRKILEKK